MIEFQNLTVCYAPEARHPINAVENINLTIKKGEWVFLVGPSGAGKSTLLKLLHCGLHAPTEIKGRVLLEGQNIVDLSPNEIPYIRRKTGVVFQDFQLLAQKTAWENIAFALRVIGAPQKRIARDVPRVLDTVGLAHKAHAQPHELSGGEQQRIAIARAIVNNPSLLLADEPTGNLDPDTASGIAEVLRRINEELGTTVVMATHDRHLVDSMKKRVIRVHGGGIASDEEGGVYHPEDDEPSSRQAPAPIVSVPAAATPAPAAPQAPSPAPAPPRAPQAPSTPSVTSAPQVPSASPVPGAPPRNTRIEPPSEPVVEENTVAAATETSQSAPEAKPRIRYNPPSDAFARETLENEAPVGSDENPIVQYGKQ